MQSSRLCQKHLVWWWPITDNVPVNKIPHSRNNRPIFKDTFSHAHSRAFPCVQLIYASPWSRKCECLFAHLPTGKTAVCLKEHHSLQNTWMVHTKLSYFVYMYFSPVILYTLPGESLRFFPYQQDLRSKRLCWQGNCTTVIPRLKYSYRDSFWLQL